MKEEACLMNTCGWGEKSISRIDIVAKINVRDFNLPIRRRMVPH